MMLNPLLEANWVNAILPEIILALFGILLMLLEAFVPRARGIFAPITVIAIVITAWAEFMVQGGTFFGGTYQLSPLTRMFDFTFLLATLLAAMFAREYLARERISCSCSFSKPSLALPSIRCCGRLAR